ncbi:MAG: hypothetical protein HeimC3_48340 [Candidatus Heimdallarchaeota archaeon LC_3]|nr:MAG: hypothetical protein HeimC3_48340 [Candidatus Heimdallarchaeota archaeon LC_3]
MNQSLENIIEFVEEFDIEQIQITDSIEEKSPDLGIGSSDKPITRDHIWFSPVSPSYPPSYDYNYYLDGVQQTVITKLIRFSEYKVPLHLAHIAAGIMFRNPKNGLLEPTTKVSFRVLLGPFRTLEKKANTRFRIDKDFNFSSSGNIYTKITQQPPDSFFVSDTSLKFSQNDNKIDSSVLGQMGLIRSNALSRVRVLRTILELGLAMEFVTENPSKKLIIDGPLVNLETYKRLVSKKYLKILNSYRLKFQFLKSIIGSVKTVIRLPNKVAQDLLNSTRECSNIFVWNLNDVTSDFSRHLGSVILSAIFQLRPSLLAILPDISSGYSALVRFDIPIPAIIPPESDLDSCESLSLTSQEILSNNLCNSNFKKVLSSILSERWIYPQKNSHRSLVELFPIEQIEKWLISTLDSPFKLKSIIN